MAHHYTFFGVFGGVTRQCSMCKELLVVNASSNDLTARDAHHLWSSAFERHIQERHGVTDPASLAHAAEDCATCPTLRIVM